MATTTTTTLFSTLSLWLFLGVAVAILGFSNATTDHWANQTRCSPIEKEALLEFKKHLTDPSNRLATWNAAAAAADDDDCCSWYGVSCRHGLGASPAQYVTGLRLGSLSQFQSMDSTDSQEPGTLFGGKVNSALLNLKHLKHLDLSYNDFGGINIPSFIGSMTSLRYLNLSGAGFGGMIPHQLGNLSNLQYLTLKNGGYSSSYDANVENLEWMSGLSSLKFLDLSGWNLSKVLNWNNVILTTLPSLLQLHLSQCQLPSPNPHLLNNNINASSISILDLSENSIGDHSTTFLSWISNLNTLSSLNLGFNQFHGSIPRELQNMTSLQELYLDWNSFNSSIPNWLYGSHSTLQVLSLSYNFLLSFEPQSGTVINSSSLSVLDLTVNRFQGPIPNEIQNMTSLQKLDLSSNYFNSSAPNWLDGLTHLEYLDLHDNNLKGKISSANWDMPSLISFVLSPQLENKLEIEGGIPNSFKNSCNLKVLNLGGVKLRQDINQVHEILSLPGCVSNGLEKLRLDNCELFGNLATTNKHFGRLTSLKYLDLSFNNLSGALPVSIGSLTRLENLYLDGNSLVGDVSEDHFENLKILQYLLASGNQLKLKVSPNWIPPFDQMVRLELGSWHIGPQFPTWLRSLENLESLDLSNSGISSTIPVWFWNLSSKVDYLNLSHNQIHGVLPSTLSQFNFSTIDLRSNRFTGPLPLISSESLSTLDLSDNSFSGSISKLLCPPNFNSSNMSAMETNYLQYLNLGENLLYGEIPNCLAAWPHLLVFNLTNNKLNGTIPESILGSLLSLHLRNNSLSGELPRSLVKCTDLIIIDVGENELVGNISSFASAESLSAMKILILRSNKFSGPIPEMLCQATSLHILDLANNFFDGTIPSCFGNLSAMATMSESTGLIRINDYAVIPSIWVYRPDVRHSPSETALLPTKGYMLQYSTNLGFVKSLDFSSNKLYGKIPDEITNLSALISLNLSHNALSGRIPKNIGFMKELQSMDLSANQLSGEIPESISSLTFLGKLNLSQNRLSGRIPSSSQIQTFDATSFAGNELCSSPLPNKCSNDVVPNDANDEGGEGEDDGDGMIWFYVSMAFGFVGGFWCFVGPLLLKRRWRFAYSQFLDSIWLKLHRFGMF